MDMKRISEIMIPLENYPSIRDTDTLRQAIEKLTQAAKIGMGGSHSLARVLLVFDELNVLVGLLRRRDILRGLEPQFLLHQELDYRKRLWDVTIDPNLSQVSPDQMLCGILEKAKTRVFEVMRPLKLWVDHDDHVMKAIYEMVDNNLSILPVLKGDNVVGVVRSVEVFKEAARIVLSHKAT